MRFREKDKRGLHPSEAECPKGKTQIITILFVDIVLTPDGRSEAESNFPLRWLCRGRSLALPKEPKARRVLNEQSSGIRH